MCAGVVLLMLAPARSLADTGRLTTASLQALVDDLRSRLGIEHGVSVAIVPGHALVASVAPLRDGTRLSFHLSIDESFVGVLDNDELSAVVAHELGHVWVSTHHPYLQTERLANSIAMRAVSRESLERVYSKLWGRDGRKGDMLKFLGPPPQTPSLVTARH